MMECDLVSLQKNKIFIIPTSVISLVLLLAFITVTLSLVFSKGICCADDAYLSVVAKNLANGLGYTSTIQAWTSRYTLQPYDPLVGTGPTIILPAALFIKLFGNTYWAPGLANVTLWSLLFICIGFFLKKYNTGIGLLLFTLAFLYLAYSLMTYHFEHWYALLGEVPAALLVLLGVLCFLDRDKRSNQLLTGILFGLAIQAKLLTLFAFLVFLAVHTLVYWFNQSDSIFVFSKKSAYRICFILIGFVSPLIIFELWKFSVLGRSQFIENWRQYLAYAGQDGARLTQSSLIELYNERAGILRERFGILLIGAGILLAIAWLMVKKENNLKRLFLILVSIVIVYSFWWVFLSIGRPRYFIIGLILMMFVISLPLLANRPKSHIFPYFLLIIFFASGTWARLMYPFEGLDGKYFAPTVQTQGLLSASKLLSEDINSKTKERIVTQWWGTAADLEYIMDTPLNFTTYRDKVVEKRKSFWMAINTRFMGKEDADFVDLLEKCKDIQEKSIYVVAQCEIK